MIQDQDQPLAAASEPSLLKQPAAPEPVAQPQRKRSLLFLRLAALVAVIALSVFIYAVKDKAAELSVYGYPGIFLLAFMGYATVLLPAPVVVVVSAFGSVFHPLGVALAAGMGATLGEFTGYLAGFSGQGIVEKTRIYQRLEYWMKRNGPLTVLVASAIPNPFFDLAGLAAGALKMRPARFLFFCLIGEILKMLFFAYSGAGLGHLIK